MTNYVVEDLLKKLFDEMKNQRLAMERLTKALEKLALHSTKEETDD